VELVTPRTQVVEEVEPVVVPPSLHVLVDEPTEIFTQLTSLGHAVGAFTRPAALAGRFRPRTPRCRSAAATTPISRRSRSSRCHRSPLPGWSLV
jgi:hypothetical protein